MAGRAFLPRSVEGFRLAYGRAPTPAELRACIDHAHPPTPSPPVSNGCTRGVGGGPCYDDECYICDPQGILQ
jgi:hypothetical protein